VQHDLVELVLAQALEGAGANVQGHVIDADAARRQRSEQGFVEMQSRSRCCRRTRLAGIDGLVALLVGSLVGPRDVGRQRHMAVAGEQGLDIGAVDAAQIEERTVATEDLEGAAAGNFDDRTGLGFLADLDVEQAAIGGQQTLQQQLHLAAGALAAVQPRRPHAGVVEHQQITRAQPARQLADRAVGALPG
jgi:hypothetical protein